MDTQDFSENQATIELIRELISDYIQKDGKSLRWLSDKSKVSRPYITQLYKGEIPVEKIKPVKLFKVIERIDIDKAYEVASKNQDWLAEVVSWKGINLSLSKKLASPSDLEDFILQDDFTITAFILSTHNNGVTKDDLMEMGGRMLLNAADRLESKGVLIFNGFSYVPTMYKDGKSIYSFSRTHLGKVISACISKYNPAHAGHQRNHRSLITASVSTGYLREICKKIDKLREEIDIGSKLPENKGNNPMFLASIMDTFKDELDDGDLLQ